MIPVSLEQEVIILLFMMVISNLVEFILLRGYGLRARMLAVLFLDHLYVVVAWAFNIDYVLFLVYLERIQRVVPITADLVLNTLFIITELAFIVIPYLFPELKEIEEEIFQRNEGNVYPKKRR